MTTSTDAGPEILIVAAEASSGLYAQRLLEHWQAKGHPVRAFGIGTQAMERLGFERLGCSEDLAVVGLQEVISHFPLIRRTFHALTEAARVRRPKVALLLDYPDFNLRLAKKLKGLNIPVVYYISPQVWAWRQGRVKLIKKVISKMLVLFPFEQTFYQAHQVPVEFVGHPLLDEIDDRFFSKKYFLERRSRFGVQDGELLLALMPGSRRSELKHHLDLQLRVAKTLHSKFPSLKMALFVAPSFETDEIKSLLPALEFPLRIIKDEPFEMIHMADVVLCASGTATLMVGLMQRPMVIIYRMNAMTAWIARRFVRSTAFFGLINLVIGRKVVPELFQEEASVERICRELELLLKSPETRNAISLELAETRAKLGDKGVTPRVAKSLEEFLR